MQSACLWHLTSSPLPPLMTSRKKVCKQIIWLTENWILKQKKWLTILMQLLNPREFKQKSTRDAVQEKNQTDQVSALPTPAPSDRQKVSQKITSVVVLSLIHNRHCQIQSEKQKLVTRSLSPALYYMWKYKTACIFLKYSCLGVSRIFNCSLF